MALQSIPLVAVVIASAAWSVSVQAQSASADVNTEQIGAADGRRSSVGNIQQAAPATPVSGAAGMVQLPPGLAARSDREPPERSIGEARPDMRKRQLYAQVAEVWQVLRMRGQQPTPELIAREIGPDNLTLFLNTFPGTENMFGADSDVLPVQDPADGDHGKGITVAPVEGRP